jgi:phosphoglucosamine mutase
MGRELFGTDGIRGEAGKYPLDPATVSVTGSVLGEWVAGSGRDRAVVIGMDTRESGPWIAAQLAASLRKHSVSVSFAGVTTTPAVAYLAKTGPFAAGVMISASHNPYHDNGIKVIGHSGFKLPDDTEAALEWKILAQLPGVATDNPPYLAVDSALDLQYSDFLASILPSKTPFSGLEIVMDCANGGASALAPELFERLGASVFRIGAAPDGRNINLNCGSLHLAHLQEQVIARKAALGVAFDGDADRALFVSRSGKMIDGDAILLIMGRALLASGRLSGKNGEPVVVATVMSNLGLEIALTNAGIRMLRTPVGDRYVLEEMVRTGAILGGEQSGHVIFLDHATTGDGLLTALLVVNQVQTSGRTLDQLADGLEIFPQRLVNVRVRNKRPLEELSAVREEIRAAEESFGKSGRVLVRFSGTEPLARVMVEGPDLERVERFAGRIAATIQSELGSE